MGMMEEPRVITDKNVEAARKGIWMLPTSGVSLVWLGMVSFWWVLENRKLSHLLGSLHGDCARHRREGHCDR